MYYINVGVGIPESLQLALLRHLLLPHFSTGFSTMKAPQLTTEQWDKLIEQYTQIIVDGMDWKDMERFVFDTIQDNLREYESRQDICDDIKYTFDEELLDELLDNVTTDTPKVDPSTYTYGLDEGESISFPVHGT